MKRRVFRHSFILSLFVVLFLSLVTELNVRPRGEYIDKNHVALFILEYGDLPNNYVPKSESSSVEGNEWPLYDAFENREGTLPASDSYTEVYINAYKADVGPERIVFSSDHVFYSPDHYLTFSELTEWKILGVHRVFLILFCLDLAGGIGVTLFLVYGNKTLTISDIKTDIKDDLDQLSLAYARAKDEVRRTWKSAFPRK